MIADARIKTTNDMVKRRTNMVSRTGSVLSHTSKISATPTPRFIYVLKARKQAKTTSSAKKELQSKTNDTDAPNNLKITGQKLIGESIAYVRPLRYERYEMKEKDFLSLSIHNESAHKFRLFIKKPISRETLRAAIPVDKDEYDKSFVSNQRRVIMSIGNKRTKHHESREEKSNENSINHDINVV